MVVDDGRVTALRWARRLGQLYLGLALYGLSGALMVRARLGLDPWDVLHQGLARVLHLQIGTVLILVGALVLVAWWPLRQWPGVGTISNVVVIGLAMNASLDLLGSPRAMPVRILETAGGIVLCGFATGLYIGARLGPGPRDGLMTGLVRRTGGSIRLIRTGLELSVLIIGWLLGGTVGVGTIAFAVAIGPLVQIFLPRLDVDRRGARPADRTPVPPTDAPVRPTGAPEAADQHSQEGERSGFFGRGLARRTG